MYEAASTASIPLLTRTSARKTGSMISTLLPIFGKKDFEVFNEVDYPVHCTTVCVEGGC